MRTDTYRESQTGTSPFPLQWLHLLLHPGTDRLRHLAASAALASLWQMASVINGFITERRKNLIAHSWQQTREVGKESVTTHTQASQLPHTQAFWQILSLRVWLMSARTNYDNGSNQRVRDRVVGMLIHKSAFTPSAPSLRLHQTCSHSQPLMLPLF